MSSNKIYEMVTERVIAELEKGNIPWKKPWRDDGTLPANAVTKKSYRGMNLLLLPKGYSSPYFVSFKQAQKLGGNVKKGEKGHLVTFWKFNTYIDENDKEKQVPMLRYYTVFNTDQTTIPEDKLPKMPELKHHEPIREAEQIINNMPNKPELRQGECRAYYSHSEDLINMPRMGLFENVHHWYATLFHELGHSTGHKTRCNRSEISSTNANHNFGSKDYSREELVAEMTSAFLSGSCGINNEDTEKNNVAYIQSWLTALKNDIKMLVTAAGKAQKASDYILGIA